MDDGGSICWQSAILLRDRKSWLDAKMMRAVFSSFSLSMLLTSHALTYSIHMFRRDTASSRCSRSLFLKNKYSQRRHVQRNGGV